MYKIRVTGVVILLCLINNILYAAAIKDADFRGSLSGVVTDALTNRPLAGATVVLPDLRVTVETDENGQYAIKSLPDGKFTIKISFVGYKTQIAIVTIRGATTLDFKLDVAVLENESVVVTGVASTTPTKRAPTHISVVSEKSLQQAAGTTLLDAVAKVPGVAAVTTGPAIAKPSVRGLGYNRVVTLNDGIKQEGQQWGDEHGLEIDGYSAKKVEILRGPASLMYGSDALGGVLNIITNTPVANNTIGARLSGSVNGNNNMQGGYANVSGNIEGWNWNAYGSIKSAGDYKNRFDGPVLNSRFNEQNFGGYFGVNKSWGYSHLVFSNFNQNVGMIEGERDDQGRFIFDERLPSPDESKSRKLLDPWQHIQHFKVALDNSFNLGNGSRIVTLVGFQRNQRKEFGHDHGGEEDHDHDHEHDHDADGPASYFDLKTVNYNLAYHFPFNNGWKTAVGSNGMVQSNTSKAGEALIPDYELFDFGVYAVSSKSFDQTTITGGLRFDSRNISSKLTYSEDEPRFEPFRKSLSSVSGSIGLAHDLNERLTVKVNASKGFRAPNLAELAANGAHEGTFRYEIGNKELKSESAFALDLGVDLNTEHVSFNLSPYFNHIKNYIYFQKMVNAAGADSLIAGINAYMYTQQNANMYGLEATLDIHPHPLDWLHFENTFSYTRGIFADAVDGSANLPLIPPMRLLTELRTEFPELSETFRNLYAKVDMTNVRQQRNYFSAYGTETGTPGYTLFDFGIGTDLYLNNKNRASVILSVNNIGDVAYQDALSRLKYAPENPATGRTGVFNMGRNFTARLIIPFEWKLNSK